MRLILQNLKSLPTWRTLGFKIFESLPRIVLFISCAAFFIHFVWLLISRFIAYDTTVLIRYEAPKNIVFPAFTICGCSSTNVACPTSSWVSIGEEMKENKEKKRSIRSIMDHHSFTEEELVTQCYYFRDSREPEKKFECTKIETVVESLLDGRKCFTYFTILHNTPSLGQFGEKLDNETAGGGLKTTETTDQYTAFIYVKVNFTQFHRLGLGEGYQPATSVHDSNVIFTIHQTNVIPTMLDSEYIRIEPGHSYEIHFGKQVTKLMEKPYSTKCQKYDPVNKPRSRNECIHLCSMKLTLDSADCLNHYEVVTRSWLTYLEGGNKTKKIRYCANSDGNEAYPEFVRNRRHCQEECARDCTEENYNLVTDQSSLTPSESEDISNQKANETVIIIWPDRKMYELVDHHREIDFFELIGTLGGHAHIWLGLSAIQLYDVFYVIIKKIKVGWKKFVFCS